MLYIGATDEAHNLLHFVADLRIGATLLLYVEN